MFCFGRKYYLKALFNDQLKHDFKKLVLFVDQIGIASFKNISFQCIVKVVPYFSKNKILQVKEEPCLVHFLLGFFSNENIVVISFHNEATDNK